jgi:hypothetical protein
MEIYVLQGADLSQLLPICEQMNWALPTGRAVVAKEDGKIIGFVAMQLLPHLEPIWCDVSHRGSGLADTMVEIAAADLELSGVTHFLSIVRNAQSKRLAVDVLEMQPVEGSVYLK